MRGSFILFVEFSCQPVREHLEKIMFDKLLCDHAFGIPGGRSAATPSSRAPRGTLASSESKGKCHTSATPRGSSKLAKVSSSRHPSTRGSPSAYTCPAAIPLAPVPRDLESFSTKPQRPPPDGSLYTFQSLEGEMEG
ncbi:UNVERIFIED_CONTAM: hypothetical protein Sradi_4549400 [Sesamum radiatum]|uniref:Uncharacterized protein n=1 Tax=Sesamum radiatum TaxID=300843 RepID=A0AAW2ND53_SESRA